MGRISTNISIDKELKKEAQLMLKKFGMDLSSFVSMSLRQMLRDKRIHFELSDMEPNKQTLKAMQECDDMERHPKKYKTYNNVDELFEDLNA